MVHTTAHYVNFINVERTQIRPLGAEMIHYTQPGGITGHFMLLIMLLMYTTATQKVRHQCFEAFWYTHHLAFFFMIALYTHATGCFVRDTLQPAHTSLFPFYNADHCLGYYTWRFTIWPGILYFGERLYREVRARRPTKLDKVLVHPSGAMELRIQKSGFKYKAGQWLFLQVPGVSKYQWHPFTITSAPNDPYISVHIRQVGDFTQALGELFGAGPSVVAALTQAALKPRDKHFSLNPAATASPEKPSTRTPTRGEFIEVINPDILVHGNGSGMPIVRIDGPYGAPAEGVFTECEVAVLIGAGIGVTPFAGILKQIWYLQRSRRLKRLRKVEFFWICRDAPSFGWFQTLLRQVEEAQTDPGFLRINIYLTQAISEDMLWNLAINGAGAEFDPLTLLRSRTMFGRPNFKTIYASLRDAIEAGAWKDRGVEVKPNEGRRVTVGTYFCGPPGLAKTVRRECEDACTVGVDFTFAKEHF
jgi:NADPH oxidase